MEPCSSTGYHNPFGCLNPRSEWWAEWRPERQPAPSARVPPPRRCHRRPSRCSIRLDFHFEQRGAEGFSVRVDGERRRDPAAERALADELQRAETRQLVARDAALDDAGEVPLH